MMKTPKFNLAQKTKLYNCTVLVVAGVFFLDIPIEGKEHELKSAKHLHCIVEVGNDVLRKGWLVHFITPQQAHFYDPNMAL